MNPIFALLVVSLATTAMAGDPRLISASGKYEFGRTVVAVDLTPGQTNAINYAVTFTLKVPNTFGPEFGGKWVDLSSSNSATNFLVNPHAWAFYVVSETDVWFYDGLGQYKRMRRTVEGLKLSATCTEPTLGSSAPRALKRFVRSDRDSRQRRVPQAE